jgi:hypothetical protein
MLDELTAEDIENNFHLLKYHLPDLTYDELLVLENKLADFRYELQPKNHTMVPRNRTIGERREEQDNFKRELQEWTRLLLDIKRSRKTLTHDTPAKAVTSNYGQTMRLKNKLGNTGNSFAFSNSQQQMAKRLLTMGTKKMYPRRKQFSLQDRSSPFPSGRPISASPHQIVRRNSPKTEAQEEEELANTLMDSLPPFFRHQDADEQASMLIRNQLPDKGND